jgi:hypothetical protein
MSSRDGWVCGICRDPTRPVHRPLAAAIILASDLPKSRGGTDPLRARYALKHGPDRDIL